MKKALIFGAGGFVGPYLARELAAHGYEVCGSGRSETGPESMSYIRADLLDESQVKCAISAVQPDVIVNLAGISSVGQSWSMPQATVEVNVIGALSILEAARKQPRMPKVLLVGSSEEYAASDGPVSESSPLEANNPYGISKIMQERFAALYRARYGMKVYCVRPFNHTGAGQRDTFVISSWCRQAAGISKSGKPGVMRVGNLDVKRDFSDVRDIVRAYRMVLESDDCETVYNVGSGKAIALRELLDYIVSLSEQLITVETDPALFRPVDTPYICCDRTLIKEKLGWEPKYTLFETVRNMMAECINSEKKGKDE